MKSLEAPALNSGVHPDALIFFWNRKVEILKAKAANMGAKPTPTDDELFAAYYADGPDNAASGLRNVWFAAIKALQRTRVDRTSDNEDVTDKVASGMPDDESMPLVKCVCGKEYRPWDEIIGVEAAYADPMPCCGARLYWVPNWRVMRVKK